jgi:hypothetical protein
MNVIDLTKATMVSSATTWCQHTTKSMDISENHGNYNINILTSGKSWRLTGNLLHHIRSTY